jgi:CRP-like cAMP-binding protein
MFAEALACAGVMQSPVSVIAASDCRAVFFSIERILGHCANACAFHSSVVKNLMRVIARKNIFLTQKLSVLSKRTTREKLMAYLLEQSAKAGSSCSRFRLTHTLAD